MVRDLRNVDTVHMSILSSADRPLARVYQEAGDARKFAGYRAKFHELAAEADGIFDNPSKKECKSLYGKAC